MQHSTDQASMANPPHGQSVAWHPTLVNSYAICPPDGGRPVVVHCVEGGSFHTSSKMLQPLQN